jgi:ubiquinone/menaquinone biosynthesis C-methylase UbiE
LSGVKSEKERIERVFRERDRLTARYSLSNPGNRFNFEQLRDLVQVGLEARYDSLSSIRMLDLGSGDLYWPEQFVAMGVRRESCFASDLLVNRLIQGRAQGRQINVLVASGERLPFADATFDLVSQFTMMTSVLDNAIRKTIASEMIRILRPGGYILWYDFRYGNPANKNTRAIGKNEIKALFQNHVTDFQSLTLVPPLARKIGSTFYPLLKFFAGLPILRAHYLAWIGPKGNYED